MSTASVLLTTKSDLYHTFRLTVIVLQLAPPTYFFFGTNHVGFWGSGGSESEVLWCSDKGYAKRLSVLSIYCVILKKKHFRRNFTRGTTPTQILQKISIDLKKKKQSLKRKHIYPSSSSEQKNEKIKNLDLKNIFLRIIFLFLFTAIIYVRLQQMIHSVHFNEKFKKKSFKILNVDKNKRRTLSWGTYAWL